MLKEYSYRIGIEEADEFEKTPVQEEKYYTAQEIPVQNYSSNEDTAPIPNVYTDIYSTTPQPVTVSAKPKKSRKNGAKGRRRKKKKNKINGKIK